ncbi:polysaccharide deacetylase family protein [Phytohabitans sp. ZYX-F-186]|uniref:Polysaccharide deacetylase family protein n=1 Tax=Phytohabitans maris TaxID=3071409 RepID=A0ABU0ZKI2_9ACTN|nr:polysaccharide deacetylase family protein [Phytohabitans sp. ZYX-F-186]MDQ7907563.1 polysaccharide deacetylase family protein [Phytohabitans sp. ZYX-F-186]
MNTDCSVCRQRIDDRSPLKAKFVDDRISWPEPYRMAVSFVVNYQGSEALKPKPNGYVDYESFTEKDYGAVDGVRRMLRLLKSRGVRATFMVCGALAEHFPDEVLAIKEDGHEIAGHGYHHEVVTDVPVDQEREIFADTLNILERLTGDRPTGWRSCHQSPNTTALAMEMGLRYNSNSYIRDMPFLLTDGSREIVEVIRQPFGDSRAFGGTRSGVDPAVAFAIWSGAFDTFYGESELGPVYCPFSFHPEISGRAGRINAVAKLIDYVQGHDGLWFATSDEIARRTLECAGSSTQLVVA